VSQSPTQAATRDEARNYIFANAKLTRLIREGRHFSGHEKNCVFLNTAGDSFANVSSVSGLDFDDDGRCVLATDWDADGDTDLWLINRTGPRIRFMRNDQADGSHFLSVKLEGRTCNRDAIGARVELYFQDASQLPMIRTLRAGDGFMSQSSKWIHFGLGNRDDIDHLIVRWPGSKPQTVKLPAANARYRIVQDDDQPRRLKPIAPSDAISPSPVTLPDQSQKVRTVLGTPVAMPVLTFDDFGGKSVSVDAIRTGPQLINLWATWCKPCIKELKELTRQHPRLQEAGVKVIALCVDGLGDDHASINTQPDRVLKKLNFKGLSGRASEQLLNKINLLYTNIFMDIKPLPIPTSLLIAPDGRLAAIYKGPIEIDQLMRDIEILNVPAHVVRNYAHPVVGKWLTKPHIAPYEDIVKSFLTAGYFKDAIKFASYFNRETNKRATARYLRMLSQIARAMVQAERIDDAAVLLIAAIKQSPQDPSLYFNLGLIEHQRGHTKQSIQAINRAIDLAALRGQTRMVDRFRATLKRLKGGGL
jgi:peroxiredoxin